jgi:uroporphyrinogen-III decarboxylase
MDRSFYINLANSGLRLPIGADLVLQEKENPEKILRNGLLLGKVLEEAAHRYHTPVFAISLMDLMLEKTIMLQMLGVKDEEIDLYHFTQPPTDEMIKTINEKAGKFFNDRVKADIEAIEYIAKNTDLIPTGMSIGPFSLLTKLVKDPITAVYFAGSGITQEEDNEVKIIERLLDISIKIILSYLELKIKAGAKIIIVAEPAANKVYFSPKQIEEGSDIFMRYCINYNMQIKKLLDKYNVDLFFHCCGEITDYMLKKFTELRPVILSLGSSRVLWEDAKLIPNDIVLFGNLPSKKFWSNQEITVEDVKNKSCELIKKMKEVNHPFILGSECDVLLVKGCEKNILDKVNAFVNVKCA